MTTNRKGRPLLACAVGIAFVSYVQCTNHQPVGNLRPVPGDAEPIAPVGNLRAPEPLDEGDAATSANASLPDAATTTVDASAPPKKKADAGALLPIAPIPTMHPVGNLRPPPTHDPQ
jgi:hypothetical protein